MARPLRDRIESALRVQPLDCRTLSLVLAVPVEDVSLALLTLSQSGAVHDPGDGLYHLGPGPWRRHAKEGAQMRLPSHTASDFVVDDGDEPTLYDVRALDGAFADSDERLKTILNERPSAEVA